jgi:hypothetical protein
MTDGAQQPEAERVKPRGEAGWKAHLQKIAESNDRVRAAGRQERREREDREAAQRRTEEQRMDAEFARSLGSRYSN